MDFRAMLDQLDKMHKEERSFLLGQIDELIKENEELKADKEKSRTVHSEQFDKIKQQMREILEASGNRLFIRLPDGYYEHGYVLEAAADNNIVDEFEVVRKENITALAESALIMLEALNCIEQAEINYPEDDIRPRQISEKAIQKVAELLGVKV